MRRSRIVPLVLVAALAACGESTPAPSGPPAPPPGPSSLKVMTQNLYLGADLDLLLAPDVDLPRTVEQIWANVQATDFPARARLVADAIQAADPDVVALQEVSLWRVQSPGDHLPVPDATTVAVDFLDVISRELASRGLAYRVAETVTNGDVELTGSSGNDYRLTDRDVLLAKVSLPITATASGTYAHLATITLPSPAPHGPPLQAQIRRGWVSADVRAGGRTVRVFGTHLEAFSADVATQQVSDLLAVAGPAGQPTLVVGDMNLPPGSGGYARFVAPETRLADAWSAVHDGDPGLTCCWNPDLRGGTLATRIDLELATPELRPLEADRLEEGARTPSGLSPSDHLGLAARFDVTAVGTTAAPVATAARPR